MAIPQNRLSTEPVIDDFLSPDDRNRTLLEDFEAGPIALNDPSAGLSYQVWHLTWDSNTDNFIATPELVGSPSIVLNAANVIQCSFAFDQNGHINITYTVFGGNAYLYWYDTNLASWVVDQLAVGANTPTLCLDDKRTTQTSSNDVQLWYTKQQIDTTYNLYMLEQRERYLDEQLMAQGTLPNILKLGMHYGLRNQILLYGSQLPIVPPVFPPGPVDPQANLDFELGDVYWSKTGDFAISINDPYEGNWSAILNTIPANYSTLENNVYTRVIPEETIILSYAVKSTIATTINIGFSYYNIAKAILITDTTLVNVTTNWTIITNEYIVPINAVYARIFIESNNTNGIVSIDKFTYNANLYNIELAINEYFMVELDSTVFFEVEV